MINYKYLHVLTGSTGFSRISKKDKQKTSRIKNFQQCIRLKSIRNFSLKAPKLEVVIELLSSSYGTTSSGVCAVPSAGSIYGLQFYLFVTESQEIYHFSSSNQLINLKRGLNPLIYFDQFSGCPIILFIFGHANSYAYYYGIRGYRYMLIEAGHFAQEFIHHATMKHLGICPIGAFDDEGLLHSIGIAFTDLLPLYAIAIGEYHE